MSSPNVFHRFDSPCVVAVVVVTVVTATRRKRRVIEGASHGPRGGCRPWVIPHPRPSSPALAGPVGGGV